MSKGIRTAPQELKKNDPQEFDSRRYRIQVAIPHTPKNLDIITLPNATALQTTPSLTRVEEVLFVTPHGLLFKPKVFVFFYNTSDGNYASGKYFFGFGAIDDYLEYRVTESLFQIVHVLDDFSGFGFTSIAPGVGPIRMKFFICSNPVNQLMDQL